MKHNNDITIPEDYQEGYVKEQMKMRLSSARKSFDRPAYFGTVAQAGHVDDNKITDYNVKS